MLNNFFIVHNYRLYTANILVYIRPQQLHLPLLSYAGGHMCRGMENTAGICPLS